MASTSSRARARRRRSARRPRAMRTLGVNVAHRDRRKRPIAALEVSRASPCREARPAAARAPPSMRPSAVTAATWTTSGSCGDTNRANQSARRSGRSIAASAMASARRWASVSCSAVATARRTAARHAVSSPGPASCSSASAPARTSAAASRAAPAGPRARPPASCGRAAPVRALRQAVERGRAPPRRLGTRAAATASMMRRHLGGLLACPDDRRQLADERGARGGRGREHARSVAQAPCRRAPAPDRSPR